MKPVSYQGMSPPLNGVYPPLDHVLSLPNVMHCEKCGFASTDGAAFKKHMNDHAGTRFYCFYCNNVSFSEAELNAHLKQHTEKYTFKCPHCGQGYMRWLCLLKHIDRLHRNGINYGHTKPGTAKVSQVPVSSASSSAPAADLSSLRPVVRVKVPASSTPAFALGKDKQRGKTLDTNELHATNGTAELLSPLNGLRKQNRALTVSLPEEVSIPAGCSVELVEVKTVNGTKELKLRLISQQENETVIKGTRTMVSQNVAPEKQILPTLNHPNILKSTSLGTGAVGRKSYETMTANVEHPGVFPANKTPPSQMGNNKIAFKRNNSDVINLECKTVTPNKVPKSLNPIREVNSGNKLTQREPMNHKVAACPPSISLTRVINRLPSTLSPQQMTTCVSQRPVEERKNLTPEISKPIPTMAGSSKSIARDVPLAVKQEPTENDGKNKLAPASGPLTVASDAPNIVLGNPITNLSFSVPKTLNELTSFKSPVHLNGRNSKMSNWDNVAKSEEKTAESCGQEPENFPVISSVFSLSQQPEDVKGSIQPLVMALRGIVMDKSTSCVTSSPITNDTEQVKGRSTPGSPKKLLSSEQIKVCVKADEPIKDPGDPPGVAHTVSVKEEKDNVKAMEDSKSEHSSDSKLPKHEELVSQVDACTTTDVRLQVAKSENKVPSKFLTVSLKRVQLGVWKKNKRGLKLRISKYKTQVSMSTLRDCTVLYPMPLKLDQLVKQPGPNQPVVVLNHPKPRSSHRGARTARLAEKGATEMVPKCQILKMRLSKVMGQKYEVMGCTVGDIS